MRPMRPDLKQYGEMRKKVFHQKLIKASKLKSKYWTLSDLNIVLRNLKSNISRDQDGYLNVLFKPECIGDNFRQSLLLLMNNTNKHKLIPYIMLSANVTTIPKPGSKTGLNSERGIFRVGVLRNILMRLIYNQEYPIINQNMTDFSIGGR